MPAITGAPLPISILRGVSLKVYWTLPNAALNQGCTGSMHDAFSATVPRAQRLGADHLWVTTWIEVADGTASTPVLDAASVLLPDSEMSFITSTAKSASLDVWLAVNIPGSDEKGVTLPATPSQQWYSAFLDQYTQFIVQTAQTAQANGVKAMMLNWYDFYIDLTNYETVYVAKMTAALSQVRAVFSGKVLFYDVLPGGADPNAFAALYKGADAIIPIVSTGVLTATENQNLTLETVKAAYKNMFTWMAQEYASFPKPLVLNPLIQSHRNFLQTGWVEDGVCVSGSDSAGNTVPCVQDTLQTDFSVQAIGYEALFEAAMESGLNILSFEPDGYWYVDVILPEDSFPNTSQSIRNKPAEAIVQRWFAK